MFNYFIISIRSEGILKVYTLATLQYIRSE